MEMMKPSQQTELANTSPVVGTGNGLDRPAPEQLADYVINHRREFREYVLEHSEAWHREHLGRLYRGWEEDNRQHFDGRLFEPYITLAEPSEPSIYGQCSPISGFGGRLEIRLRPSLLLGTHPHIESGPKFAEGRFRFIADVLLHESIHQWQMEIVGNSEVSYHGHGPLFRDKANEIGQVLGLPRVRNGKRRGKDRLLKSCSHWPHCVRSDEYYLHALRRDEMFRKGPLTEDEWTEFGAGLRNLDSDLQPLVKKLIKYHSVGSLLVGTEDE